MSYQDLIKELSEEQAMECARYLEENSALTSAFSHFLASLNIDATPITYDYNHATGITAKAQGLATHILKWATVDKEGLYAVKELRTKLSPKHSIAGHLFADNYAIMFSPFFRRGYDEQANWAPSFITTFDEHTSDSNKTCHIRVDADRVRINMDGRQLLEFDHWYGPKFNKTIDKIPDGFSRHSVPLDIPYFRKDFFFNSVETLNVKWTTANNLRTFQAMEFKSDSTTIVRNGIVKHPVRYFHSEYDLNKEHFIHADGAMQFMTNEEYASIKDGHFDTKEKYHIKAEYMKLFKINGIVSTTEWVDLVSHFFSANPLVHEYFTGALPANTADAIVKLRANQSGHSF